VHSWFLHGNGPARDGKRRILHMQTRFSAFAFAACVGTVSLLSMAEKKKELNA